ncbi:MAG: PIN domain-containing protein [Lachnospiraceae bacterium]|nr:PIN domain-containing protein [Lachnospiraceae bacterium]MDD6578099.1 PIN domain-containing protein [Lachnospiraceae bacterium]
MSVYLIDYENVHYAGWEGIDKLTNKDEVILFYSENASTIPMDLHIKVVNSGANLRYIHVAKTAKNYLDFQLSALSGYLVAQTNQTEFVVVSKDTGFNAVVDFWNHQDFAGREVRFSRREQIAEVPAVKKADPKKAAKKTETLKTEQKKTEQKKTEPKKTEPKKTATKKIETKQTATKKIETKKTEPKKEVKQGTSNQTPVKPEEKKAEETKQVDSSRQLATQTTDKKKAAKKAVKQADSPKTALPPLTSQQKAEIRAAVKPFKLPPSSYTKIYHAFKSTGDKNAYYSAIVKTFNDQKLGSLIYKATRKTFDKALEQAGMNKQA